MCSAKAPLEWSDGSPGSFQRLIWSTRRWRLTSSCEPGYSVTDLEVLHAVANFFNDAGVIASSNGSLGWSVLDTFPVRGVESYSLGPDDDEVVLKLGEGNIGADLRDALFDMDNGLLGRHVDYESCKIVEVIN